MEDKSKTISSSVLSEKEIRRYSLQINIPEIGLTGQEKIKQAKILVIGAGGKGTAVLQNLATLGVGKIGISDNFPVKENELVRQHLYGNSDLGKQKAIISKQKLLEINHMVDYELHNVCLTDQNIIAIAEPYDLLIDATDNYTARFMINDAAIKLNKPLIFCQIAEGLGKVSVLNYQNGPSLRCLFPKKKEKTLNKIDGFACQVSVMSIIGGIAANEAIKIILGKTTALNGKLMEFNANTYECLLTDIEKNPENFK